MREKGWLEALAHGLQLVGDGDVLRAVLDAGAAIHAIARPAGIVAACAGAHHVLLQSFVSAVRERGVVGRETAGDVDSPGAGHAVVATGAVYFVAFVEDVHHFVDAGKLVVAQRVGQRVFRAGDVRRQLLEGSHARKHHGRLGVIPYPAQPPRSRGGCWIAAFERFDGFGWQSAGKLAAQQRLHDDHWQSARCRQFESCATGLIVHVHVVVLYLAEIPSVSVDQAREVALRPMIGKPDLTYFFRALFPVDPFLDAQGDELIPLSGVGHIVNEIVVEIVGAQARFLLGEKPLDVFERLASRMGELRGDEDAVAQIVSLDDIAQRLLVATVEVRRVEIVDALFDGLQHQRFGSFQIDAAQRA